MKEDWSLCVAERRLSIGPHLIDSFFLRSGTPDLMLTVPVQGKSSTLEISVVPTPELSLCPQSLLSNSVTTAGFCTRNNDAQHESKAAGLTSVFTSCAGPVNANGKPALAAWQRQNVVRAISSGAILIADRYARYFDLSA